MNSPRRNMAGRLENSGLALSEAASTHVITANHSTIVRISRSRKKTSTCFPHFGVQNEVDGAQQHKQHEHDLEREPMIVHDALAHRGKAARSETRDGQPQRLQERAQRSMPRNRHMAVRITVATKIMPMPIFAMNCVVCTTLAPHVRYDPRTCTGWLQRVCRTDRTTTPPR